MQILSDSCDVTKYPIIGQALIGGLEVNVYFFSGGWCYNPFSSTYPLYYTMICDDPKEHSEVNLIITQLIKEEDPSFLGFVKYHDKRYRILECTDLYNFTKNKTYKTLKLYEEL